MDISLPVRKCLRLPNPGFPSISAHIFGTSIRNQQMIKQVGGRAGIFKSKIHQKASQAVSKRTSEDGS